MIRNPLSGRLITINGPTYKKLVAAGYRIQNDTLVLDDNARPKVLTPPIPDDMLVIIFSFLELKEIMNGYFVNRKVATTISMGFHMYGKSIVMHMLKMQYPGNVLKRVEDILSDEDIVSFFERKDPGTFSPYHQHISIVRMYLGRESRSWKLLDIFLQNKIGKDVETLSKRYRISESRRNIYTFSKVYHLSYDRVRIQRGLHGYYPDIAVPTRLMSLEEKIKNGLASLSQIQIMCMKCGLSEYNKVNSSNKEAALSELRAFIDM